MAKLTCTALHFTYEVPLYYRNVLFIFGYDRKRAAALIERYGGSHELAEYVRTMKACKGVCAPDAASGKYLIWLEDLPRTNNEHGALVHELYHLTEQIMDEVGMKHKLRTSSEAYAYLMGQITADVLGRLWAATNPG